jgi:hypothetical protein
METKMELEVIKQQLHEEATPKGECKSLEDITPTNSCKETNSPVDDTLQQLVKSLETLLQKSNEQMQKSNAQI